MRLAVVAVFLALVGPARAEAVRLVTPNGAPVAPRYQGWADSARVPTVRGQVTLHIGNCPSLGPGWSCGGPGREIWIVPPVTAQILRHELGHVFDGQVLTDADRTDLERAVGASAPWVQDKPWPESPHELFAVAGEWNKVPLGVGLDWIRPLQRRVRPILARIARERPALAEWGRHVRPERHRRSG